MHYVVFCIGDVSPHTFICVCVCVCVCVFVLIFLADKNKFSHSIHLMGVKLTIRDRFFTCLVIFLLYLYLLNSSNPVFFCVYSKFKWDKSVIFYFYFYF